MTTTATQAHHLKLLAALRRVNAQPNLWDELDAMPLISNSLRPHVEPQPTLDREQLKSLQVELIGALNELAQHSQRA